MQVYLKERTNPPQLAYWIMPDSGESQYGVIDCSAAPPAEENWGVLTTGWCLLQTGDYGLNGQFEGEVIGDHQSFCAALVDQGVTCRCVKDDTPDAKILEFLRDLNHENDKRLPNVGESGEAIFRNAITNSNDTIPVGLKELAGYSITKANTPNSQIAGYDFLLRNASLRIGLEIRVEVKSYYSPSNFVWLKKRQIQEGLSGPPIKDGNENRGNPRYCLVFVHVDPSNPTKAISFSVVRNPFRARNGMPHVFRDLLTLPMSAILVRASAFVEQRTVKGYDKLLNENNHT